jgi:hypothetical protein
MTMMRWGCVLGLVLLLAIPVHSQTMHTGSQLLKECRTAVRLFDRGLPATMEMYEAGHCIGYIDGMQTMHLMWEIIAGPGLLLCVPAASVKIEQQIRVLVKYLETHPEKLHEDPNFLFLWAMQEAFPCKASSTPPQR